MRARRREINIFNMSLLDILCGALGAFCFMMLVALPYYIPPGSGLELRKAQQETDRLLIAISNMKERLPDQKSIEEMDALIKQLEAQIKTLQGRVNIMQSEKDELQTRLVKLQTRFDDLLGEANELQADKLLLQDANQKIETKNRLLAGMLERRKGFAVSARATSVIDLLLTDEPPEGKTRDAKNSGFQTWLDGKMPTSLLRNFLSNNGSATEIRTEMFPESVHKLFVRLTEGSNARGNADVEGALFTFDRAERVLRFPKVALSPERSWALIGTVTIDKNFQPALKTATTEERDAEWQSVTNSTPPPAPTTPTPSEEARKKIEEARAARQVSAKKFARLLQLQTMHSEADEAEALKLSEELMKELPAGDRMRREVESIRERDAAERKRQSAVSPTPTP